MIKTIRKYGLYTKGLFYCLIGTLTLLAAIDMGSEISGKSKTLAFIHDQVFGKILLVILATGLFGYAAWKMYSGITDAKEEGSDKKGYAVRIGYFFNGLMYALIGVSTVMTIMGHHTPAEKTQENLASIVLSYTYGQLVLFLIAGGLLGNGIYLFYTGISKKFMKDINNNENVYSRSFLEKSGMLGYIAQGIAYTILAYFAYLAGLYDNSDAIAGIEGMFGFLHGLTFGNLLMGIMSLGFLAYGIYQYFLARYSKFEAEG